jgi:hypothetical protein
VDPVIADNWLKCILFLFLMGLNVALDQFFFGGPKIVGEVAMWKRNLLKNGRKGWFGLVGLQHFL